MTTAFQVKPYVIFIEIKGNIRRKKLHRLKRGNVRALIQFKRERLSQHLKSWFFNNRSIHLHLNSMRVIRLAKKKQVEFSTEIGKPFPAPVYSGRSDWSIKGSSSCCRFWTSIHGTLWTGVGSGLLILMLEKLNWFCLANLITLVVMMGLFLRKKFIF